MKTLAVVLALLISVIGVALFARAVAHIVGVVRLGQPTLGRSDRPADRWKHLLIESFGHTRMLQWSKVGAAHWVVFIGFLYLFFTLVTAYGQIFVPESALPIVGHWFVYEWITEGLAWLMLACIGYLIVNRFVLVGNGKGRFFGSRSWQAIYVEFTILGIAVCILALRALEYALAVATGSSQGTPFHFPLTFWMAPSGMSVEALETAIVWVAALKIIVSMAWFCVIGLNLTMGVAWHRFSAWPNIWFKRKSDGGTALGAMLPINIDGKPVGGLEDVEELTDEQQERLGVGRIEDFAWKGLLDFTSCTECGRCQSQCPAWNTEKPLSPKLLMMGLREHAYAKAPWLQAAESARGELPEAVRQEAERPLVGVGADAVAQAEGDPIRVGPDGAVGVVDPDVLWSCTSCGACVQQCPVDIEHVDHIMDMRRFEVLVKSEFPEELNGLYKGLESKGNPWNLNKKGRLDWTKDLQFPVPVVGSDVEDLSGVEYLFWVGCAGAFEDRAKKTTQAVAELLNTAGVSFAVLGTGETCTGDPARRSGNEFVFQQLAAENAATLTEAKAHKVITTCAHCLNTLKNEYPQVGVELEVVHHTQLLNRLVRDGRLTPVAAPTGEVAGRSITYHDPCYLGRHNQIYEAPRDLLGAIPGAAYAEMPRHGDKSFCCGAGGARMWMEEKIGTRINRNRTSEALTVLGQDDNAAIATACPFCRVMISDGLTAEQQDGRGENVEVLDVAQLLLESVRRGQPAPKAVAPVKDEPIIEPEPAPVAEEVAEPMAERATERSTKERDEAPAEPQPARDKPLSPIERAKLKAKGGATAPAVESEPAAERATKERDEAPASGQKLSPLERAKLKAKGGTGGTGTPATEQATEPAAEQATKERDEAPASGQKLSPLERAKLKAKGGTGGTGTPATEQATEPAAEQATKERDEAPADTDGQKLSPLERAKLKAKGSATAPEPAAERATETPAERARDERDEAKPATTDTAKLSPIERAKLKAKGGTTKPAPARPETRPEPTPTPERVEAPTQDATEQPASDKPLSPIESAKLKAKGGTTKPAPARPETRPEPTPTPERDEAPTQDTTEQPASDKPLSPIERAKLKAKGGTTKPAPAPPVTEPAAEPEPDSDPAPVGDTTEPAPAEPAKSGDTGATDTGVESPIARAKRLAAERRAKG
ncbi:Fe-S cluster protein [Enemella evansiae]|uniref:(Fe-S)-binding protein n=1 Tax=Enemella evansiae TaxID=2016499 RepID=UPI000B969465|nr:(Fe-S)-binding protein [Enemella evansiae]OYO00567.1 Fe-S cluster protein [Enemella evansiae]